MQPPRWKMAILIWLGIYPTVTLTFWLLAPFLAGVPLPLRTLFVTLIVVPVMVWVMLPNLQKLLKPWLQK